MSKSKTDAVTRRRGDVENKPEDSPKRNGFANGNPEPRRADEEKETRNLAEKVNG